MNAKNLLPLTAAVVFALCAGAMVVSATQADTGRTAAAAERIVDMPTVTVTPDAADLAHYNTYKDAKIVDLAAIGKLDKSKPTAFFCNGPECWKSYKAAEQAKKMGFAKVYWLRSGMPEWRAKNLPVRKQG